MTKYNLVEIAYMTWLRAKHGAFKVIDSIRPHIFLRKNLADYQPREFFGMEVGEVLDMLGFKNKNVKVIY